MNGEPEMIALKNSATTEQNNHHSLPKSGILSERSAIIICGLGVGIFAVPILVVIQVFSSFFWGGATVYKLLNGSGFDQMDEV
jgi:hypothetical protein